MGRFKIISVTLIAIDQVARRPSGQARDVSLEGGVARLLSVAMHRVAWE